MHNLLVDYFSNEYKKEEIEKALSDFVIKVEKGGGTVVKPTPPIRLGEGNDEIPDFIIIKTTKKRVNEVNGDLYYAVRHCWRVKLETVLEYKYVLGVVDGVVKAVYEVEYWNFVEEKGRYEFFGHLAPEEISRLFINKEIPERFKKPGLASPVLYSKTKGKGEW